MSQSKRKIRMTQEFIQARRIQELRLEMRSMKNGGRRGKSEILKILKIGQLIIQIKEAIVNTKLRIIRVSLFTRIKDKALKMPLKLLGFHKITAAKT